MDKTLLRKSMKRMASKDIGFHVGAAAVGLSAAVGNPLPLLAWLTYMGARFFWWSPLQKHASKIIEEEQTKKQEASVADRLMLRNQVMNMLTHSPFVNWVCSKDLPDYANIYGRLERIRDRAIRIAHDRKEIEHETESDVREKFDYFLVAFLRLLKDRLFWLQVLTGVQMEEFQLSFPRTVPAAKKRRGLVRSLVHNLSDESDESFDMVEVTEEVRTGLKRGIPHNIPSVEGRIVEYERKIKELEARKTREPAAAKDLDEHKKLIEKRLKILRDCQERDVRVNAKLDMFVDYFEAILDHISAAQFSAEGVTSYMNGVVEQVEETEKFAQAMRPATSGMFDDLPLGIMTETV